MKIIKILGLICFLTIGILAQAEYHVIDGTVVNENDKPIEGATVTLTSETYPDIKLSVKTNKDGYFEFSDRKIKIGKYILVASVYRKGEVKTSAPVEVFVAFDLSPNAKLQIIENSTIREEVTVIASGTNQTIDEVSKTVNIIEAKELRDRADFTLVETLRTIPGFRVQQLGGFGRTASIKTRGLRNQDTAILLDGIRFRDASSITGDASAFLSDFTLTSVSRIEVLRGSGSSLYGTNAIGGTIDFQTPKPTAGWSGQIGGALGTLGLGRFRGNISNGNERFGFNIGVSRTVYSEGIDKEDDANNTNLNSRIEYNPFEKTNISARFFISDAFVRLNTSPRTVGTLPSSSATIIEAVPLSAEELKRYENGTPISQLNLRNANFIPDANDPDNFQKSKFFNGQVVLTQIVNNRLIFQGYYQGLKTSRKNTNGASGVGFQAFTGGDETSIFDGLINTAGANFKWTANENNLLTFGYEYEREKFSNEGITIDPLSNFFTSARQSSNTFFVQDLASFFNKRLQIAGGFRAQWFSLENPVFIGGNPQYQNLTLENPPTAYTFDGSISYFFEKSGTKLRAHAGNGYRLPSLYERFGTFYSSFSGGFVAQGEPFLKPERSIGFDVGIDQTAFKNRARVSLVYFYTDVKDSIDYGFCVPQCLPSPDPFGRFSGYYNSEGRIARGIETSAEIKPFSSLDLFVSYAFVNSDERNPLNLAILESLGVPKHQFSFVATQRIGKRFLVNFDFTATSSYLFAYYFFDIATFAESYRYFRYKGVRRGDLTASYEIPFNSDKLKLRIFGTIENLFDYEYYENGFRTIGRTARGGISLSF